MTTTTTPAPEKCWTCGETGSHHIDCPKSLIRRMPEMVEIECIEAADEGEIEDEDDFADLQDGNDMDRLDWDEHFPHGE